MKILDLSTYSVVELTQQEMIAVEGGSWLGSLLTGLGNLLLAIGKEIDFFWEKYVLHTAA